MTPFLLALRFLNAHRVRTALLTACFAIVFLVPISSRAVLAEFGQRWMQRASDTPLVLGARGSEFDLALHATWFRGKSPGLITVDDWKNTRDTGYAQTFPLHLGNQARQYPVVGTTIDYLHWRGLSPQSGRLFAQVGECVIGHEVAQQLQIAPGDTLLTDPPHSFSLASPYPLEMAIVGVLHPSDTPDDYAVFVDLKTAWIAGGLGHGHEDLRTTNQPDAVLEDRGDLIVGSPNLLQFNRITPENRQSFHFHGDDATFPMNAVVLVPHDQRSEALLLGRYLSPTARLQVVRPSAALDNVLNTILQVQTLFDLAFLLLVALAVLFLGLVIFLTLKVRQEEMAVLRQMGASRRLLIMVQLVEYLMPTALGALFTLLVAPLVVSWSGSLIGLLFLWRIT